jgi:ADP-L-glycero-D-manno-heptose 6-epimerase
MKRRLYTDQYIVITGGAGLLGASVVRHLNGMGYTNLVIVDTLDQEPKWRYLVGSQFQELLLPFDLPEWLQGRSEQIEAILHLGSLHEFSGASPDELIRNNYRGSIALAEYALKYSIRFIYTSCAQTYGDGSRGFSSAQEVLPELQPLSLTGFSHYLFDLWCLHQGVFDQVVCCKVFDLLGRDDLHKPAEMRAVRNLANELVHSRHMTLLESPQPEILPTEAMARDFIDVRDAAELVCSFLRNDHAGIFNIGTGHATCWEDLAKKIAAQLEMPADILLKPMPPHMAQRTQLITCAELKEWKRLGIQFPYRSLDETITWILQGMGLLNEEGGPTSKVPSS